ncbi:MAG: cytochrome c-type biogenesis protein CcmH [Actinobacteria bacterium]|nr:cytochrome c-type biogenesis protein CcmH [Actinomycetota bacterium]MBU1494379.1 cytochrome c-type biogenesis protein CcmH [Actinomycetota bacterium]MBU1864967.1 cytochrome c-type biogenesis protein CcmH [Actinomycetota bacterium]
MSERARKIAAWVVTLGLVATVVWGFLAGEPTESDRVFALGARIKCPVCQGESIQESPSETAMAMLDVVAEKVEAGQTDEQILEYFTDRYGDGIRLDPRFEFRTMLLWLLPAAALIGGGLMIWSRRRRPGEEPS